MLKIFKDFISSKFKNIIESYEKVIFNTGSTNNSCTITSTHSMNTMNSGYLDSQMHIIAKSNYIEDYIQFYTFYINFINKSLKDTCKYSTNLFTCCFKELVEKIQSKNARYNISYILPIYIDNFLNFSWKDKDKYIKKSLLIFPSIPNTDAFIENHARLLCKRLFNLSYEHETTIINQIKFMAGSNYTQNTEDILKEYLNSNKLFDEYSNWRELNSNLNINNSNNGTNKNGNSNIKQKMIKHNILFINRDCWPRCNDLLNKIDLSRNEQINTVIKSYSEFIEYKNENLNSNQHSNISHDNIITYNNKKNKKNIDWNFSVSTFELEACFNKCVYVFHTGPLIALILLMYTEQNISFDFKQICNKILYSELAIELALEELIKYKILVKKSITLNSNSYEINKHFKSEERYIIINEGVKEDFFKKGNIN